MMTTFNEIELGNQYADRWVNTIVHYSAEWDCWLVTAYDMHGNQVGDSDTEYRKVNAVACAQAYLDSDRCDAIEVRKRSGEFHWNKVSNRVTGGSPFGYDS